MKGARRKFDRDSVAFAAVREETRVELDELQLLAEKMDREIHLIAVPEAYALEIRRFIRKNSEVFSAIYTNARKRLSLD